MLNLLIKAASGEVSHTMLADAMYDRERPDFLANCPESYINKVFAEMSRIVDLVAFKKEATDGFSKMGLSDDILDDILVAITDAKNATEVARLIYGIGVYLLTDLAETDPEAVQAIAKRWTEDDGVDKVNGDGFYTVEAEQAMYDLCEQIFGAKTAATEIHETVVEEPVAEATVAQQTAPAEQTEVKSVAPAATIRGIKPQQNHKNKKHN